MILAHYLAKPSISKGLVSSEYSFTNLAELSLMCLLLLLSLKLTHTLLQSIDSAFDIVTARCVC